MDIVQYLIMIGIIYLVSSLISPVVLTLGGLVLLPLKFTIYDKTFRAVVTVCNVVVIYNPRFFSCSVDNHASSEKF